MVEKELNLELEQLESKIDETIVKLKNKEIRPEKSGIGKMLIALMSLNKKSYDEKLLIWKPISAMLFDKFSPEAISERNILIEKDFARISFGRGNGGELDDMAVLKPSTGKNIKEKTKTVRLSKEKKVKLPKEKTEKGNRDRSGFLFEGETYGKGPVVLAVIKSYVKSNPKTTFVELKKIFPDTLLKGYGLFTHLDKAIEISKVRKRFFLNDHQVVKLKDTTIAICNQFDKNNVIPFVNHAKKLGFKIEG